MRVMITTILTRGIEAACSSVSVVRRAGAVMASILVLSACGDADEGNTAVPDDFSVTLERTICFGACPAYSASVDASGLVQYDGTQCVAVNGHRESRLSQEHLRA